MRLRTVAYVVVARATQRFAPGGLGVSRAPEDTQTDHRHNNRSGKLASPCPYRGCLCRHPDCLSNWLAALSVVVRDGLVQFAEIILPPGAFRPAVIALRRRRHSCGARRPDAGHES